MFALGLFCLAERVGFEPTVRYERTPIFKTGAINQLDHLSISLGTINILAQINISCQAFFLINFVFQLENIVFLSYSYKILAILVIFPHFHCLFNCLLFFFWKCIWRFSCFHWFSVNIWHFPRIYTIHYNSIVFFI